MIEEGDVVLCTVERIEKTIVFVKIHGYGKDLEGSIITSEIAPGRIRNIRDYVVPNKKIVCKVLRISGDRIDLSLRRVTKKEQKEVIEEYNQEKSYISILKSIIGDKVKEIIKEIKKAERVYDFIEESKENPKKLEKLLGKENANRVLKIIKAQKQRKTLIKKEFQLSSTKPDGVKLIKKILGEVKGAEIKYISAGKYNITKEAEDPKKADQKLTEILEDISKKAKKLGMEFKIKEKK
jgi:translation initiation factor 2 alpha subunit (eIF-2alpha)